MKKIFITGVSAGIGKALATECLADDAEVYGISRRQPEGFSDKANFHFRSIDLENVSWIPGEIQTFVPKESSLDLVVLNAASIGKIADVKATSIAEFEDLMRLNVWANKAILDTLFSICRVNQVVAISSCAATAAFRGTPGYCISKAALNMLMALYAEERKETHFSVISPGLVETEMQQEIADSPDASRFSALTFLKTMRANGCMLKPEKAAQCLLLIFENVLTQKSGSFIDASSSMQFSNRGFLSRLNSLRAA